ncbi:hypothetical protein AAFF_G00059250 [Aldrovandia affinis]|uniref:Targeting protein for Xklp2 n=1 Tax=Aldrovandia affinis TaxID=143900 RepID=A0AAD7RZW3_9TELE|nr:hypothetical protein AAFF_G00059250 [Aldrovandia affinis]
MVLDNLISANIIESYSLDIEDKNNVERKTEEADFPEMERVDDYEHETPHLDFKSCDADYNLNPIYEAVTEDNQAVPSIVSSNLMTSWSNKPSVVGHPPGKRLSSRRRSVSKHREMAHREERENAAAVAAVNAPPGKRPRRSCVQQHSVTPEGDVPNVHKPPGPTSRLHTASPSVLKSTSLRHKSSEEQELEHIQALQKEVVEHRKKNEASYKAAIAGSKTTKKPAMSPTIPVEFHFHTEDRVKPHPDAQREAGAFAAQLRRHSPSPMKANRGTTVPKPFNLSVGTKRRFEESTVYVPMAQQIEEFQKRTPPRYHLRNKQTEERGPPPAKAGMLKITNPKTPRLMTRQRSRPTTVKSSEELEAEELKKIQQFKFKALELNRKILEGGVLPKKPAVKEATQPVGFELELERRLRDRQAARKPDEPEQHTFHPRPVPVRILEEVVGVPEKKVKNCTVPESPAFALKNRVRLEQKVEDTKPPSMKANPMPHFGLPFHPKPTEKSQLEACPFSFEARERERQALKEKRLEELRQAPVPKFKAQLLPDFSEVHLPEKKVPEPTKVEPFRLLADERGAAKSDRWEQTVKDEHRQQAEATVFKARPNTVTHKEPFVPKRGNQSILVPEAFQLSSECRAVEREEYNRALCEKEALRACMLEEQRREMEKREKEEIAQLRQDQVYKAQPVRHYKQLELKKSETSLTVPQSPNFSNRFRL